VDSGGTLQIRSKYNPAATAQPEKKRRIDALAEFSDLDSSSSEAEPE